MEFEEIEKMIREGKTVEEILHAETLTTIISLAISSNSLYNSSLFCGESSFESLTPIAFNFFESLLSIEMPANTIGPITAPRPA